MSDTPRTDAVWREVCDEIRADGTNHSEHALPLLDLARLLEKEISDGSTWIPVSEPPKASGYYMGAGLKGYPVGPVGEVYFNKDKARWGKDESWAYPTHWMPLPEGPK